MKSYDVYFDTHRDYDVSTGIATYLSSLGFLWETAVLGRIGEIIRKNAAFLPRLGLKSSASAKSEKSAKTKHVMALECSCAPAAKKPVGFGGAVGFRPFLHVTVRELLTGTTLRNSFGFQASMSPAVGYFDFVLPSVFGLPSSAASKSIKNIKSSVPIGVQSALQFRKNTISEFWHRTALGGFVGRILTLNTAGISHESTITASVVPAYVTLRTLGDMDLETISSLDPMTIHNVEIKQTL